MTGRIVKPIFGNKNSRNSYNKQLKSYIQKQFKRYESLLKTTGQTHGVWHKKLSDGTVIEFIINFPNYIVNVVPATIETVVTSLYPAFLCYPTSPDHPYGWDADGNPISNNCIDIESPPSPLVKISVDDEGRLEPGKVTKGVTCVDTAAFYGNRSQNYRITADGSALSYGLKISCDESGSRGLRNNVYDSGRYAFLVGLPTDFGG